ncbi:MAG: hypothetical protein ACP5K9_03575 [Candidatus Micrarchaeia archaeon]
MEDYYYSRKIEEELEEQKLNILKNLVTVRGDTFLSLLWFSGAAFLFSEDISKYSKIFGIVYAAIGTIYGVTAILKNKELEKELSNSRRK